MYIMLQKTTNQSLERTDSFEFIGLLPRSWKEMKERRRIQYGIIIT